jgi:cation diffusion facilitator family transporter
MAEGPNSAEPSHYFPVPGHDAHSAAESHSKKLSWAFTASWAVNWLLLIAKTYIYLISNSKAVLASLADSAVDLASQVVISLAEHYMGKASPLYPVGRARLEALGVIGCACIMSMASLEVLQFSAFDLYNGLAKGERPQLDLGLMIYIVFSVGTVLKLLLYFYCESLKGRSDSMAALAEDHLNDVISVAGALVTAVIASHWKEEWYVDPVGAIVISLWIIWRWVHLTYSQVKKIVGYSAPPEFVQSIEGLAHSHHALLTVDCTRAYHFGPRFNVEMEIILPGEMTVTESHDIALDLQHKIEALEDVERAFIHVDYRSRDLPEHKVERMLLEAQEREEQQARLVKEDGREIIRALAAQNSFG